MFILTRLSQIKVSASNGLQINSLKFLFFFIFMLSLMRLCWTCFYIFSVYSISTKPGGSERWGAWKLTLYVGDASCSGSRIKWSHGVIRWTLTILICTCMLFLCNVFWFLVNDWFFVLLILLPNMPYMTDCTKVYIAKHILIWQISYQIVIFFFFCCCSATYLYLLHKIHVFLINVIIIWID